MNELVSAHEQWALVIAEPEPSYGLWFLVAVNSLVFIIFAFSFATQYQLEFFWIGLAFNLAGIAFIGNRLWKATKEHALCVHA